MKQNKYDEPEFFASYSAMPRSIGGLDEAGEWHAFRALLPSLAGKRVLDLGCGFGWHCRYAREQGARSVLGVDLSERMLERARAMTDDSAIEYRLSAIEDVDLPPESFDAVISSLAFHYVERFDVVCRKVRRMPLRRRVIRLLGRASDLHGPGIAGLALRLRTENGSIGRSTTIRGRASAAPRG